MRAAHRADAGDAAPDSVRGRDRDMRERRYRYRHCGGEFGAKAVHWAQVRRDARPDCFHDAPAARHRAERDGGMAREDNPDVYLEVTPQKR